MKILDCFNQTHYAFLKQIIRPILNRTLGEGKETLIKKALEGHHSQWNN